MSGGHQSLYPAEGKIAAIVARILDIRFASVDPHSHFDGGIPPILLMKAFLRLKRRVERLPGSVECRAECIPDDMENITLLGSYGGMQNGMVTLAQIFPLLRMLLG